MALLMSRYYTYTTDRFIYELDNVTEAHVPGWVVEASQLKKAHRTTLFEWAESYAKWTNNGTESNVLDTGMYNEKALSSWGNRGRTDDIVVVHKAGYTVFEIMAPRVSDTQRYLYVFRWENNELFFLTADILSVEFNK